MSSVIDNESQSRKSDSKNQRLNQCATDSPVKASDLIEPKPIESQSQIDHQLPVLDTRCTGQVCDTCDEHRDMTQAASKSTSSGLAMIDQAACVMLGARMHASDKVARRRLGAQALHWGVLFVGALVSLPMVLPTLSQSSQDWVNSNILSSTGNWRLLTLCVLASGLFAFGFVSRLGTERVHGGCAMLRRLGPAAILGVAWSVLPSFAGVMLVLNMEPIRLALLGAEPGLASVATGMAIYVTGFVLLAGIGCLPTVSQAILAGYAFGLPMGVGLALIGFGGASLIGYELVGRVARGRVESELQRKPKAAMLRDALVHANPKQATLLVALLRASPSAPFALTNLLLASLGVSRKVFVIGTVIGMLPRTLAAVMIGQQFTGWTGEIDKPKWMIVAGIIAIIIFVVLVSKIAAKALKRVADQTMHAHEVSVA